MAADESDNLRAAEQLILLNPSAPALSDNVQKLPARPPSRAVRSGPRERRRQPFLWQNSVPFCLGYMSSFKAMHRRKPLGHSSRDDASEHPTPLPVHKRLEPSIVPDGSEPELILKPVGRIMGRRSQKILQDLYGHLHLAEASVHRCEVE